MSFLLDTNICSAHLKLPSGLAHRFIQHSGRLYIPAIALGELYCWAFGRPDPSKLLHSLEDDLLQDIGVIDFDRECAREFGRLRIIRMRRGEGVFEVDLMIASVALVHDLTLVTHNTKHFRNVPGLRLEDWLAP
jgi:tRNA(fMet)-specific endonuclease VapC